MGRRFDTQSENLTATVDDGVAVITMNHPERKNALTRDMMRGIELALADFESAPDVRFVGFDAPKSFLGGYGRDDAEAFRHLPYIASL